MPNSVETQGLTVEEAIQTALNQLGTSRERVEIKILNHPRGGFLGIGARRAKVRATLRKDAFQDGEEFDMSPNPRPQRRRRGRGSRGRPDSKPEGGGDERSVDAGQGRDGTGHSDRTDRGEQGKRGRDERGRDDRRGRGGRNLGRGGQDRVVGDGSEPQRRVDLGSSGADSARAREPRREARRDAAPQEARVEGQGPQTTERNAEAATRADGEPRQGRTRRRRGGRGRGRRANGEGGAEGPDGEFSDAPEGQGSVRERSVEPAESQADFGLTTSATIEAAAAVGAAARQASAARQVSTDDERAAAAATEVSRTAPEEKFDLEKIREQSWELVSELVAKMGFEATVEVAREGDEQEQIIVKVSSPSEGLLIGRRGQTLDAMEHVLNRMIYAGEAAGDSAVVLDIGGYRERRRQSLYDMATRLRDRSLIEQRSVQISPMGPRDRRVIQDVLGSEPTVKLRIIGTGLYRRVQITPAGMAETPVSREDEVTPDDNGED